jgi:hypothetical protein
MVFNADYTLKSKINSLKDLKEISSKNLVWSLNRKKQCGFRNLEVNGLKMGIETHVTIMLKLLIGEGRIKFLCFGMSKMNGSRRKIDSKRW